MAEYHRHPSKRVNLGEYETEEDILDAIEQSRRITRLIISAVQKGSKFEVSQILEHYGLPMTSRLHFKVTNIVMEQWFSLMGIEDEEQIWNILKKNPYAMNKLRSIASGGTMVLSDMLTEWELGIGALQSKIIRRIVKYCEAEENDNNNNNNTNNDDKDITKNSNDDNNDNNKDNTNNNNNNNDDNKDPEKEQTDNNTEANGNADSDKKEDK
mmetsp:Transcript_34226/g.30040  ORF Transcript_34226/g.30040 Transcript_34226/m.30040 type:complete len:212 (+) Transcript_34226:192-827(+)|eukprot:CAMPEP_0201564784 /NCGR_PEP_ID=MMETSP0190_2-20130828/3355_1 /ASSEMBLY_ACC=CAM_ASM_000263 /TAXON_ID=37353 /ORGANISM="Rosalina sp." /LENGTH=211 /DNA_ID=CAMNT_0047981429 /DNA_START=186 /DNA_END=821 /DNA_ORIENTATION=+